MKKIICFAATLIMLVGICTIPTSAKTERKVIVTSENATIYLKNNDKFQCNHKWTNAGLTYQTAGRITKITTDKVTILTGPNQYQEVNKSRVKGNYVVGTWVQKSLWDWSAVVPSTAEVKM